MGKKPLGIKNYGSIPHLANSKLGLRDHYIHVGQQNILTKKKRDDFDTIIVTEKYDGSNVGVAKKYGNIFALTRAGYPASTSPYSQHHEFENWVGRRYDFFYDILEEGSRLVGEWLYQAHGLRYHINGEPIVFFDLFSADNKRRPHKELEELEQWGIRLPRILHVGDAISVEELLPVLNQKTPDIWPYDEPEGMVYRVERKGKPDFLAKWVRPDFTPGRYIINVPDSCAILNGRS